MSNSIIQTRMFQDNDQPLPLQVASQYAFPLQHHTQDDDTLVYSLQDWVMGLTGADNIKASQMLREFKKQLRSQPTYFKMPYRASNGKTYQTDFVSDVVLFSFAAYARSTADRPQIGKIKDYLSKAGALVDQMRQDPEEAQRALTGYRQKKALSSGKNDQWITVRELGIQARNHLTAALVNKSPEMNIGEATNTVYKNVLGQNAEGLRKSLNLGKKQNPRDNLSIVALSYLQVAEAGIATTLEGYRDDDIVPLETTRKVIAIIAHATGKQASEMASLIGVDLVTGQKQLR